jgi:hypothetical protein
LAYGSSPIEDREIGGQLEIQIGECLETFREGANGSGFPHLAGASQDQRLSLWPLSRVQAGHHKGGAAFGPGLSAQAFMDQGSQP